MNPLSLLSGVWGYVAAAAFAAVLAGAGTYEVTHTFAVAKYERLQLADANAVKSALAQVLVKAQAIAQANQNSGAAEATAQTRIVTVTRTITKEIPVYVTPAQDAHSCVTYGLVRLLYAAERGVDPATIPAPAGHSNDACAPYELSALAGDLAADFGAANGNATQLNALEAAVIANDAITQVQP